jgi:hypothetical protein
MAQPEYKGGFLRVASAGDTAEAVRRTDREKANEGLDPMDADVISLVSYLMNIWHQNRQHKEEESGIQDQMIANLEARNNQYSTTKLNEIKEAGMPDVFMGLTNVKCSHAEAWLMDIFSSSERTWGLQPTPVPDPTQEVAQTTIQLVVEQLQEHFSQGGQPLQPEQFADVMKNMKPMAEEAMDLELKRRAHNMETKIYDQMHEGEWDEAFEEFICDLVTCKAGIIKGPIARKKKRILYEEVEEGGRLKSSVKAVSRPEYWRVSPLDIYPAPSSESIQEGSLVEKIRFSRSDLIDLKEEKGYDSDAIDSILEDFPTTAHQYWSVDEERREEVEDKENDMIQFKEDIEGLEFWCSVQGKALIEYGLDKIPGVKEDSIEELDEYDVNAIVVGQTLIYIALNDDPLGRRPYSKTGWRKVPGSFWYKGVPELMEDLQRICNAAVRSMVYNMSIASGPQVDVDVDRLVPGEDIESAYPGKVWQTLNKGNTSAPAVRFFNPPSNSQELFQVYENFARLADDYTGIPAYAYGSDRVAGAGRTSSGLSMLMTSAAKGIKRVVLSIDKDIFKTVVRRQFDWNMQYDPDTDLKGDIDIVTTGAVAVMIKEQMSERRMNFLNVTNNPTDLKLTGLEGRANVLREASESLEMENSRVVKEPDEIRQLMEDEEQAQSEAQAKQAQAEEARAQLEMQTAQLDNQLKQMEMQVEQQKMQVEQQRLALESRKLDIQERKLGIEAARAESDISGKEVDNRVKASDASVRATESGLGMLKNMTDIEDNEVDMAEAEIDREEAEGGEA